jgi:hypothetical protein
VFEAVYASAAFGGSGIAGKVHWDFGDGTTADTDPGVRLGHAFTPGSYTVRLSATDRDGRRASWQVPVEAYPRLRARVARVGRRLIARTSGGVTPRLAYRWTFDRGAPAYGARVRLPRRAHRVTLRVTDATGTTTRVRIRPPAA